MAKKKAGRNDPCPCGSGRKLKHCCRDPELAQEQQAEEEPAGLSALNWIEREGVGTRTIRVPGASGGAVSAPVRERIDDEFVDDVFDDLKQVLMRWGASRGVILNVDSCRHSERHAKITVSASVLRADGVLMTGEAEAFLEHAAQYGLSPEALGAEFRDAGLEYRIIGMKPRAKRQIVCLESSEGEPTGRKKAFAAGVVVDRLRSMRK